MATDNLCSIFVWCCSAKLCRSITWGCGNQGNLCPPCFKSSTVLGTPEPGGKSRKASFLVHLLCCSKAAAWRALRTAANPQKRRCHCTFSSTSFRYEPTAQDSSFLSNDERVMFADPTTVTASPRVEATLEKKEHSRISAEPPSLKAPPTSGKTGRVVISGRLMHKYGRHHHKI